MPAKHASLNGCSYSKMSAHPSYTNLQYMHVLQNGQKCAKFEQILVLIPVLSEQKRVFLNV